VYLRFSELFGIVRKPTRKKLEVELRSRGRYPNVDFKGEYWRTENEKIDVPYFILVFVNNVGFVIFDFFGSKFLGIACLQRKVVWFNFGFRDKSIKRCACINFVYKWILSPLWKWGWNIRRPLPVRDVIWDQRFPTWTILEWNIHFTWGHVPSTL